MRGSPEQDRGPESLREILARLITARGWAQRQGRRHLEQAWAAAIGAGHEDHTRVLGLRRGIFEVEVNSPILLQELAAYQKRKLLARLRQALPKHTLTDVRFRIGTF